jgi:hypothetical protein
MKTLVSEIFKDRKNKGTGVITTAVIVAIIAAIIFLATAATARAFEKVSNCELREYGIRILYVVGPRVPLVIPLRKANSEEVYSDFFKAMSGADIDLLEKYAYKEDVEKAVKEYRNTLIGNLGIHSELVNNVFYGGQRIAPMRLSCTVCDGYECGVLHADIRMSITRISHPVAE